MKKYKLYNPVPRSTKYYKRRRNDGQNATQHQIQASNSSNGNSEIILTPLNRKKT